MSSPSRRRLRTLRQPSRARHPGSSGRPAPALEPVLAHAQHVWQGAGGIQAEEIAVRQRFGDRRCGRPAGLAGALEAPPDEACAVAPRLPRLVPDHQQVVRLEDAADVLQGPLDPVARCDVARPGGQLDQLSVQLLLMGAQIAEQQRHHREVAAADHESAELERRIVQEVHGVEAEPEIDRERGERGPQHAAPVPAQRCRQQHESEIDEQRTGGALRQVQKGAAHDEIEIMDEMADPTVERIGQRSPDHHQERNGQIAGEQRVSGRGMSGRFERIEPDRQKAARGEHDPTDGDQSLGAYLPCLQRAHQRCPIVWCDPIDGAGSRPDAGPVPPGACS